MPMQERASLIRVIGGLMLAIVVALPLSSWAAACSPIPFGASISAPGRRAPINCVHRRVRRHRRTWIVRAANAPRAFSAGTNVPDPCRLSAVLRRFSALTAADLPPPDLPPV
jgi:hypothetical protein